MLPAVRACVPAPDEQGYKEMMEFRMQNRFKGLYSHYVSFIGPNAKGPVVSELLTSGTYKPTMRCRRCGSLLLSWMAV